VNFQQRLDPNGSKRRQFDKIIEIVVKGQRPKTDYRWLSHVDFLGLDFLRRILEIQTSYMLLLRSFAAMYRRGFMAEPVATKGYLSLQELFEWSRTVGMKELYEVYCSYPDRTLVGLLVDLKLEEPFLHDEFARRLADKPFTSELILLDWGGLDREKEVEKLLRVNKIKSFRPVKQSDEDIKQSAWAKTLELWRQPGVEFWRPGSVLDNELLTPLPGFPGAPHIRMLPPEKEFWEGSMAKAWRDGKMTFLREGVPMLAGEKETIPQRAREHRRTEWKTLARREKIFSGQEDFPEDGPEAWRTVWDHSEAAKNQRQKEIRDEIHPDLEKKINKTPDVSSQMFKVLQIAKKRWGSPVAKALAAMAQGMNEKEAAERYKIPYQSLRRYVAKLKKEFLKKS
jgi:hypothetical protein